MGRRARAAAALAGSVMLGVGMGAAVTEAGAQPQADTTPPRVRALPSSGDAGKPVRMRVWATEDSPEVQFEASVFRGSQLVFRLRARFLRVIPPSRLLYYYVEWQRPQPTRGTYRFCMRAYDRAGNRSGVSCSSLRVV